MRATGAPESNAQRAVATRHGRCLLGGDSQNRLGSALGHWRTSARSPDVVARKSVLLILPEASLFIVSRRR